MGLGQRETGLDRRRERTVPAERFAEAMSRLVSGVAVVSLRRADGRPSGLLVSSLCSYSVDPPSVLMALARSSRTCRELGTAPGAAFGVHLLARTDAALARVFAGSAEDKFADVLWEWDGEVPRLADVPVYVKCRTDAVFPHGDHMIVVGGAEHCALREGEPLVYFHRRLDWCLGRAVPGPPD
ncbi:flavin reductase family protein [Streptomyces sp. PR69]|uniref:flavin reductase family protein n=1 Tax=Streptomyces sp. PR69 TaxID=2984950 RepID=UPI00226508D1|nr:flavin reductase family protein [Streptomyces sp. PR69]